MNNFQSDKPIYLQVVEEVKLKILCGELRPGDKLESVREMASRLAVNPNTIQRAFLELERQGFIVTQRAVGRFVSDNQEFIEKIKRQRIQETIQQFMDEMARYGVKPKELIAYLIEQEDKHEGTHNNSESK
ncbi:GntR family transcriptional regulator [[Clostridium] spiroforme]|nr:GntR family transcriptional regulator [Thomasclavelia spiroformis]MBM6879878.1 GntR family transcriptional regulator [Thomasclavelia spiroformis]